MESNILVSIIMPVYNVEKYLEKDSGECEGTKLSKL